MGKRTPSFDGRRLQSISMCAQRRQDISNNVHREKNQRKLRMVYDELGLRRCVYVSVSAAYVYNYPTRIERASQPKPVLFSINMHIYSFFFSFHIVCRMPRIDFSVPLHTVSLYCFRFISILFILNWSSVSTSISPSLMCAFAQCNCAICNAFHLP